jgi:predicted small lipoprotein YifL
MRTFKMLIVSMVALVMLLSLAACGTPAAPAETESAAPETESASAEPSEEVSEEAPADTGTVLNIYCWNTEFQDRFKTFYEEAGLIPDGVTVNWVITPSDDGAYQQKLDEALLAQETAAADDKVDLFLIEADYALKYVNSEFSADIYGDVGLTEEDTAGMYQYTKDICTDSNGVLKGVSWQAAPGGLIYRRSIAKDVLGSDDPADVQAALDSWDKFEAVAAQAKEKGYYMTSSFAADYRVFSNNVSAPWVNENDEIQVDANIHKWIEQTKTFMDNGYTLPYEIWDAESFNEAKEDGKAMCYFGPGWFFDFCLMPATLADAEAEAAPGNGSFGDWGIVKGPQGFFWGGTWLCAAAGSDNVNLVKDIMKTLTCDEETLLAITNEYGDFTNNVAAMTELANDPDFGSAFLGGQNFLSVLLDSAQSIDMSNITMYDQLLNEPLQTVMEDYFNGTVTLEEAWDNFYVGTSETYPNLKRVD